MWKNRSHWGHNHEANRKKKKANSFRNRTGCSSKNSLPMCLCAGNKENWWGICTHTDSKLLSLPCKKYNNLKYLKIVLFWQILGHLKQLKHLIFYLSFSPKIYQLTKGRVEIKLIAVLGKDLVHMKHWTRSFNLSEMLSGSWAFDSPVYMRFVIWRRLMIMFLRNSVQDAVGA